MTLLVIFIFFAICNHCESLTAFCASSGSVCMILSYLRPASWTVIDVICIGISFYVSKHTIFAFLIGFFGICFSNAAIAVSAAGLSFFHSYHRTYRFHNAYFARQYLSCFFRFHPRSSPIYHRYHPGNENPPDILNFRCSTRLRIRHTTCRWNNISYQSSSS